MNLIAHYGQSKPNNPVISHMSQTLLSAFNPEPDIQQVILQQQKENDIEKAIERWLTRLLVMPDHHMGELLMPIITRRFQEYLEILMEEIK